MNQKERGSNMPFKSSAQRKYMYAKHPKLAKEFESKTPKGKKLPEHVVKSKVKEKPNGGKRAKVKKGSKKSS